MLAKFISNHSSTTNKYQSVPTRAGKKNKQQKSHRRTSLFCSLPNFHRLLRSAPPHLDLSKVRRSCLHLPKRPGAMVAEGTKSLAFVGTSHVDLKHLLRLLPATPEFSGSIHQVLAPGLKGELCYTTRDYTGK